MGRRKIPREVVDYARDLYLTVDERGRQVYTLQEICNALQEKCNITVDPGTLCRWSQKLGWREVLEQAAKAAAVGAMEDIKPRFLRKDYTAEEKAFESILEVKKQAFKELYETFMTGRELLEKKRRDPKSVKDSFSRLIETTAKAGKIFFDAFSEMAGAGEIQVEKVEVILEGFDDRDHQDSESNLEG